MASMFAPPTNEVRGGREGERERGREGEREGERERGREGERGEGRAGWGTNQCTVWHVLPLQNE